MSREVLGRPSSPLADRVRSALFNSKPDAASAAPGPPCGVVELAPLTPSGRCRQSQFQTQVGDLVSQQMTSHPQQTKFAGCLLKILGITRWPGHRARYAAARDAYSQYGLRLDVAG